MNLSRDDFLLHINPGYPYILTYAATGALAGLAQSPLEYLLTRLPFQHTLHPTRLGLLPSPSPPTSPPTALTFLTRSTPPLILRATLRFACFGEFKHVRDVKRALGTNTWPRWLDTAAAGGAAGVVEAVMAHRLALEKLPPWKVLLARHPARLFCCFGTFGFLSTTFHEPEGRTMPFWKCWIFGAVAGGVGSSIVARAVDRVRGRALWGNVLPRGAVGVGTLIAVQVTACAEVMRRWEIGRGRLERGGL